MRNKKGFIKALNQFSGELTVNELVNKITNELDKEKLDKEKEIDFVINQYSNKHYKLTDNRGYFDSKQVSVFYVKNVEFEGYNTEYEKIYSCNIIDHVAFNKHGVYSNSRKTTYTKNQLENLEILSKKEFDNFLKLYNEFNLLLDKVLNDE